mmetsp:Transcript_26241/g.79179  ORF Transcript_26241/g.79179 Transcript_26241/m.79179 type:complete len:287 (-) Transcript_26241:4-864(-)
MQAPGGPEEAQQSLAQTLRGGERCLQCSCLRGQTRGACGSRNQGPQELAPSVTDAALGCVVDLVHFARHALGESREALQQQGRQHAWGQQPGFAQSPGCHQEPLRAPMAGMRPALAFPCPALSEARRELRAPPPVALPVRLCLSLSRLHWGPILGRRRRRPRGRQQSELQEPLRPWGAGRILLQEVLKSLWLQGAQISFFILVPCAALERWQLGLWREVLPQGGNGTRYGVIRGLLVQGQTVDLAIASNLEHNCHLLASSWRQWRASQCGTKLPVFQDNALSLPRA